LAITLEPMLCETRGVRFADPPRSACWHHEGLRLGFEVSYFATDSGSVRAEGTTTGLQDGNAWIVSYSLLLDESWCTRIARVTSRSGSGLDERLLESDGVGHWSVNGTPTSLLDGCFDVDLEASAMTNTLPVHRLALAVGQRADATAAYVRAPSLAVERLEQTYSRVDDQNGVEQYDYEAPAFAFACRLTYDESGLVLHYPGIARRSA
jgi:uncharacterized protein